MRLSRKRRKASSKKKPCVFVAFPNAPANLKECIIRSIKTANEIDKTLAFQGWPENDVPGRPLVDSILSSIKDAPFIVADVTILNFNVTYEIGFAIGMKKRVYLVRNSTFDNRNDTDVSRIGIFDTLGYKTYENSSSLAKLITSGIDQTLSEINPPLDHKAPVYLLESPFQDDAMGRIISRIKKARLQYRSFSPSEETRMAAPEVIKHVASSHGVVVPLLISTMRDANIHNIRAAFLAGLAHGMEKPTLILRREDALDPLDIRDFSKTYKWDTDIDDLISNFAPEVVESMQALDPIDIPPAGTLARMTIGDPMAENEFQRLGDYYLRRDEFDRTIRGEVNLAVGRKGTGKTALFSQVRNNLRRNRTTIVVDLKPEGYQLAKLKEEVLDYLTDGAREHLVIAFWEYLLLLEVAYKLLEKDRRRYMHDHEIHPHYIKLQETYQDSPNEAIQGDFSERLITLSSFVSKEYTIRFGITENKRLTSDEVTEVLHTGNLKKLINNVSDYLKYKESVWILFDNLDKGWSVPGPTPNDILILRCLIEASRKIQREMQRKQHNFHCVVFIRNDVYQLLMEKSSDFGKEMQVSLDWDDPEMLRKMLRLRLIQNGYNPDTEFFPIWNKLCASYYEGEETSQYMIDRCLMRPRNLLKIFNHCKGFAVNLGHSRIEVEDIEKGLKSYSNDLFTEANLELSSIEPQAEDIIYHFIGEDWKFKQEELEILFEGHSLPQEKYNEVIRFFLYFGFFGVRTPGKDPVYIFDVGYDMKQLEVQISKHHEHVEFTLNPAFWPALGIDK